MNECPARHRRTSLREGRRTGRPAPRDTRRTR